MEELIRLPLAVSIGALLLLGIGAGVGYVLRQLIARQRINSLELRTEKLTEDAKAQAKEILVEAKTEAVKILEAAKDEERAREHETKRLQDRLENREGLLDKKLNDIDLREKNVEERVEKIRLVKPNWTKRGLKLIKKSSEFRVFLKTKLWKNCTRKPRKTMKIHSCSEFVN